MVGLAMNVEEEEEEVEEDGEEVDPPSLTAAIVGLPRLLMEVFVMNMIIAATRHPFKNR